MGDSFGMFFFSSSRVVSGDSGRSARSVDTVVRPSVLQPASAVAAAMAADASSARTTERGIFKTGSPTRPTAPMPSPTGWYEYDCALRKASGPGDCVFARGAGTEG